jgi:hypothetical protein
MRAAWYERQGPARDVLIVAEMDDPQPLAGEVPDSRCGFGCESWRREEATERVRSWYAVSACDPP